MKNHFYFTNFTVNSKQQSEMNTIAVQINLENRPNGSGANERRTMWPEFRRLWRTIAAHDLLLELVFRVILLLAVCILQLCVKPHKRYIKEVDLLQYYKQPRRHSIVPPWATVFIVIVLPLLCFSIPDYLTKRHVDITHSFLAWTLALSINALITEIIKLITGRPRPDFFYRCFPSGKMDKALIYVVDSKEIWEGRKSFPSGHSSFAFCSMGFVCMWLCGRLGVLSRRRRQPSLAVVCLAPLLVSLGVAVSRCRDNHHHWEDVVVGSLLGFAVSYISYILYFNPLNSELSGTPISQRYRHSVCITRSTSQMECSAKE